MTISSIPENVSKILDSLPASDKETLLSYIASLTTATKGSAGDDAGAGVSAEPMDETSNEADAEAEAKEAADAVDHPKYDPSSGHQEDFELAGDLKQQAADAQSSGDYGGALKLYNQAVLAAPPSALLYAKRALVLEQLGHYQAATQDCTWALEQNPDSAKALKVRGKMRFQHLKDWHGALSDLNQAQSIDFDPDVAELLKELTELRKQEELEQAQERIAKEEQLKKKAQDIKKAQAEAKREAAQQNRGGGGGGMGGMPGGMPGGMGGMPGGMDPSMMAGLMSDPEIQEAMKNPKVVKAFQELMSGPGGPMGLMSNPAKLQELMSDPEVGPVLQKLMGKFMGGGGGAGMPDVGGMGGANPFGGGASGGAAADDIPDMEEMPELD